MTKKRILCGFEQKKLFLLVLCCGKMQMLKKRTFVDYGREE